MTKTRLLPYNQRAFRWDPGRPTKASMGFCSNCWKARRAVYMLIMEDGRQLRALCRNHAELYRVRLAADEARFRIAESLQLEYNEEPLGPPVKELERDYAASLDEAL